MLPEQVNQHDLPRRVLGELVDQLARLADGHLELADIHQRARLRVHQLRTRITCVARRLQAGQRLGRPAEQAQHHAEVDPCGAVAGRERNHLPECRLRALEIAHRAPRIAERVPCARGAGLQRDGALQRRQRRIESPELQSRKAELCPELGGVRRRPRGALEDVERIGRPTSLLQELREIAEHQRVPGGEVEGAPEGLLRAILLPRRIQTQSERVLRVGCAGRLCGDAARDGQGFRRTARLQQAESLLEACRLRSGQGLGSLRQGGLAIRCGAP